MRPKPSSGASRRIDWQGLRDFCIQALGMTAAEFWLATLRDVNGRSEVWRSIQRRQDFRAGVVCSTLANIHRDENRRPKPYTPEDSCQGRKRNSRA